MDITALLQAWSAGDEAALDRLAPAVDAELRRLARKYLRREPVGGLLQTTALIHEAYLRLIPARGLSWKDREHFYALSARIMRRILVDAARARRTDKRGAEAIPFDSDEVAGLGWQTTDAQLLALNDALEALARIDGRKVKVIELRFFGGLNAEETAAVLHVSPQTVLRDWKLAKSWLARELAKKGPS
jgi:RNA polymerase sigma factor (TIGR02999 family)